MYCKNCGKKLSEGSKYCDQCGERVELEEYVYCTYCGEKISKNTTICPHCSKRVLMDTKTSDFQTKILCIFSFLIPVLGFILWAVMLGQDKYKAQRIFYWSFIGLLVRILYRIINLAQLFDYFI